jgi:hypothetical protein
LILLILPEGQTTTSDALWPGIYGFSDFPDKIVFAFWMSVLSLGWVMAIRMKTEGALSLGKPQANWNLSFVLFAMILTYINLASSDTLLGYWQGIPIPMLVACQVMTLVIFHLLNKSISIRWLINLFSIGVAAVYLFAAGFQTAYQVRDAFHTTIVVNDLLAQSAGQIPLGNAMASYTTLLGWPLKPLVANFPLNPGVASVWYLLALQIVTLVIALSLVLRRYNAPRWGFIILVAVSWIVLDPNQTGQTAFQSFAISPSRLFLPMISIALLMVLYRARSSVKFTRQLVVVLGIFSCLAAINNIEFGLTVWVTSLAILSFVSLPKVRLKVRLLLYFFGSSIAILALIMLFALNGERLHLEWLIRVPLIYAAAGVDLLPMPVAGPHMFVSAVFIASSIVGIYLTRRSAQGSQERHIGLLLVSIGSWSALSLTYFTGRSASAALVSGYGLQLGVITAALAGCLTFKLNQVKFNRKSLSTVIKALFVSIPVAVSISLFFIGTDPRATLAAGIVAGPLQQDLGLNFSGEDQQEVNNFELALVSDEVGQTVYPANIRALSTGVRSVAKSPELFLGISRSMGVFECSSQKEVNYWVVPKGLDELMLSVSTCAEQWRQTNISGTTEDGRSVVVLERKPRAP